MPHGLNAGGTSPNLESCVSGDSAILRPERGNARRGLSTNQRPGAVYPVAADQKHSDTASKKGVLSGKSCPSK